MPGQSRCEEQRTAVQRSAYRCTQLARHRVVLRQLQIVLGARGLVTRRDTAVGPARDQQPLTEFGHLGRIQHPRDVQQHQKLTFTARTAVRPTPGLTHPLVVEFERSCVKYSLSNKLLTFNCRFTRRLKSYA